MIRITAKKDGFRRAGMAHTGTRDYPDGRFSPEQLALLQAEPLLRVEVLAETVTPKSGKGKAAETEPAASEVAEPAP